MKLVVGLGNPGRKYQGTRHNVGFDAVAELARRHGRGAPREQFEAELCEAEWKGERLLLLQPQTYMNRSGASVVRARDFYKLGGDALLVVCDDFHLDLGRLRVRGQGTSGGQKGLEDVIRCLGGNEFARLRIGVGPVPDRWNPADFVLGKFQAEERPEIELAVQRAADAVEVWATAGLAECMNRFNGGGSTEKKDSEKKDAEKRAPSEKGSPQRPTQSNDHG